MNYTLLNKLLVLLLVVTTTSCVSNKKFAEMQLSKEDQLTTANKQLTKYEEELKGHLAAMEACENAQAQAEANLSECQTTLNLKEEQIGDLKAQVEDFRQLRDKQIDQVGDLTVLSKSANDNIKETLAQMDKKDAYINLLNEAKDKADSINLALAVNLKTVLKDGILDDDIEVKVDKTVVFVNLSDKMLYNSGSSIITPQANEVLGKIAQILQNRPELEVMVEGYTDNMPIKNDCIKDNWDLSVKRATAVVRVLQTKHGVDPNKLIAAGRGEYNTLTANDTYEGRKMNRRTRIIILPKLDQFYDLLNPEQAAKN